MNNSNVTDVQVARMIKSILKIGGLSEEAPDISGLLQIGKLGLKSKINILYIVLNHISK